MTILKPVDPQSFLIGLGVAAAAYFIGPQIKQTLKPIAVKSAQGMLVLSGKTGEMLNQGREQLNNVIFEDGSKAQITAQTAAGLEQTFASLIKEERERTDKMMTELKDALVGLKQEIASLKNTSAAQEI